MTKNSLLVLEKETEKELENLEKLNREMTEILGHPGPSFLETRAAGSVLHDFYSGMEKIFKRIASRIDRDVPSGEDWHTDLLTRMAIPLDNIRPRVISDTLKEQLAEYMRFRHLFRNIYGFELKWERCGMLGQKMEETFKAFQSEMREFLHFIADLKDNLS